MVDGIYQSVMAFFIPFFFLCLTNSAAYDGLQVSNRLFLGVYIAHPAVLVINLYILFNMHRWDYSLLIVIAVSDLFVFFWTGVYTSTTYSAAFYDAAAECYGQSTFWLAFFFTPAFCLAPNMFFKAFRQWRFPQEIDRIRNQWKDGKFAYLDDQPDPAELLLAEYQGVSDDHLQIEDNNDNHDEHKSGGGSGSRVANGSVNSSRRPIYPPSEATHTQNGSDATTYTYHTRDPSADVVIDIEAVRSNEGFDFGFGGGMPYSRPSIDRTRPSYDRVRASIDRVRPSYEASDDFTSAAMLSRMESSRSARDDQLQQGEGPRRFNLNTVRRRGMSAFSKKSVDP
jgi:phospholipid-translocating ATPase